MLWLQLQKDCKGLTETLSTNADLLAVDFVDGAVNLLDVVRVRDDLVAGDDVLVVSS